MNEKQAEIEVIRLYPKWREANPDTDIFLFYIWLQDNHPAVTNFRHTGLENDPWQVIQTWINRL